MKFDNKTLYNNDDMTLYDDDDDKTLDNNVVFLYSYCLISIPVR